MNIDNTTLLTTPLTELPLSSELKLHFSKQDYKTVAEVLKNKASDMLAQPGFTYHMLQDLLEFLKKNNLSKYLQE